MRYCKNCGKQLAEGETCTCNKGGIWKKIKDFFVQHFGKTAEQIGFLERSKSIVPDCVRPDDGETPIKQYKLARLRSKIRGQYAEGRLQITNKRLMFRAAGFSSLGKIIVQQEFDVNEIAGVDIQKTNKVSVLNIIGSILLSWILSAEARSLIEKVYEVNEGLALVLGIIMFSVCSVAFFLIPRLFWVKLAAFSFSIGGLLGATGFSIDVWDVVFEFELFTLANILVFILAIGWAYILLRVCFVPNLIFSVKTKSASDAVQIRRRVWGLFFKQPQEYTGFSEVLPWDDTEKVSEELGALINDLQTMGDMAIEKWKK